MLQIAHTAYSINHVVAQHFRKHSLVLKFVKESRSNGVLHGWERAIGRTNKLKKLHKTVYLMVQVDISGHSGANKYQISRSTLTINEDMAFKISLRPTTCTYWIRNWCPIHRRMASDDSYAPVSPELSGMKIIPLRHKLTELWQFEWYYIGLPIVFGHTPS